MEKYVFSGSLTAEMKEMLESCEDFEPLDMLVSQVDRSTVRQVIEWKKQGFCRWFFVDSGAFSYHTGKWKGTVDDYIEFLNSIDGDFDVCAQLDTIPGHFGQPKKPEDYVESAEGSWDNFLYMRTRVKSPEKVMPVFHMGEDPKYLQRMLDWKDENGHHLDYIGLSPANDASKRDRMLFLDNMYKLIHRSENPDVKTHIYGFTSLDAMAKFPCYSADSITHRLLSGYAKVITSFAGIVSVSKRPRTSKAKSNWSFIEGADEYNLTKLEDEAKSMNLTLEQLQESVSARVVFNIKNIQRLTKTTYKYHEGNIVRSKKLF